MKLSTKEVNIIQQIPTLSMSLGIIKAIYPHGQPILDHMPVSLYPYKLSFKAYNRLKALNYIWQKLFVKVAADKGFLEELAKKFCLGDPFTERILEIYKSQGAPKIGMASTRIDYMGDENPFLVEFNLMSVGLNGMSDRVQTLHNSIKQNENVNVNDKYTYPINKNQSTVCTALIQALELSKLTSGIILMIVHQNQFNYGDQACFKLEMIQHGRIVKSVTMAHLIENMKYNSQNKNAFLGDEHIDAFYFRTGYRLEHFPNENYWELRKKIEQSNSIKFPSIDMILVNSKRVQSQLTKKQVLSKYLNREQCDQILSVAGEIYDFDDKTEEQIEQLLCRVQNQDFVLKPNKQGGGNNYFGIQAYHQFKQLAQQKQNLKHYILMAKIKSKTHQNYFLAPKMQPLLVPQTTCQMSTIGAFVYQGDEIMYNEFGGTLARLKREQDNEGGIAINKGVISGICIVNFE